MSFTIATTLDDALTAMAAGARPIAGGTDLVVGARQGKAPLAHDLVAIDRLTELGRIEPMPDGGVRIGAIVPHATLVTDPTIAGTRTAISDGSALVGSPATRHVGTIGGNVMNGSPAMDTGAPLVVLDTSVELRSLRGVRTLPIGELWTGPGTVAAEPDELCTALLLPARSSRSGSAYVRLEYRRAMEIAVVGAAAAVELDDDGLIGSLQVALTAVAPTIVAVDVSAMVGHRLDDNVLLAVAAAASERAAPISDLRASDRYRRHAVGVMASRAVDAAVRRAEHEPIGVPVNRSLGIGAAS